MKNLTLTTRENVYNAPTFNWDSLTYTPVSNKSIMDLIEDKINNLGLKVKSEEYRVARTNQGIVKGVIGSYNIVTPNEEFGQKIMFRNSYDKSMSFAFVCGALVWICSNGCIKGDYQYKRIHRGIVEGDTSTTMEDVVSNINSGINSLQESFNVLTKQMLELKHFEIGPKSIYDILGKLFFEKEAISITQMSIIKKELEFSRDFRHLGDTDFTAYDLYNHITESLKVSHPLTYIKDHVKTHTLFEEVFDI